MIVDELRKSILDYAIKGYLSTHNPKEKVNINIDLKYNEPFEIPTNWKWVKLKDFVTLIRGNGIKRNETTDEGIQCIRYGEIYTNYSYSFTTSISFVPLQIASACKKVKYGDILLTLTGENEYDIAKATAYLGNNELVAGGDLAILTNHNQNPLFISYLLASPYLISCKSKTAKGNIIVHTSTDKIGDYLIPLPPIEEQQRIVDKIEELFSKLDEIKPIEEELNCIRKEFSSEIKKSIILSAISGKLSYQNEAEKSDVQQIKNITKVIEPYDIPNNWIWLSHNDLFEVIGGSQPPKSKFSDTIQDGFVQLYQTRDYGLNPQPVYVDRKDVSKFTKKGDIILARYGGSLGKVFWAEEGAYNVALAKVSLKYPSLINIKYLYYYYLGDLYQSKVKKGNRSAQAGFSKDDLNDLPFPLPPIEEQQRIVEKLEQLLPLCDDIEKIMSSI